MHLFSGEIDLEALASENQVQAETRAAARVDTTELAERVSRLEAEVAELRALVKS